jgi:ubiquinone/menaquinone biosynthesis C-methylase UbiE
VVAALDLRPGATVIDVGGGSGALVPLIKQAAQGGTVVVVDASLGMLRAARGSGGAVCVRADALALPMRAGCADAVLLAFVLFHLADPARALAEAAEVLRIGGTIGTVTWATEASIPAYAVWDRTLSDAGAPAPPARRVDAGLDSPESMGELLNGSGFSVIRSWTEQLHHQWTADSYARLATGSGVNRVRLEALDNETRAETLKLARQRLRALWPTDFAWSGEVVCVVARRR